MAGRGLGRRVAGLYPGGYLFDRISREMSEPAAALVPAARPARRPDLNR